MQACPVNFIKVDETAIRVSAWLNVLLIAGYFYLEAISLVLLMGIDYLLKQTCPKNSPLGWVAKGFVALMHLKSRLVDSAPKRFAAFLGMIMLFAVIALLQGGHTLSAQVILLLFGICTLLEAAFGWCIGCLIYRYLPARFKGTDQ